LKRVDYIFDRAKGTVHKNNWEEKAARHLLAKDYAGAHAFERYATQLPLANTCQ
jgi:hypothetical protein